MNKVMLMGRLTRDPEIRYTTGDNAMKVARYTLAVDRRVRRDDPSGQTADFIGCVAFGRSAEFTEQYLRKGVKILVTGRIRTGNYTKSDGTKVYTTDVVVEEQEFAESRNASEVRTGDSTVSRPDSRGFTGAGEGFMEIPEGLREELPFS